MKRTARRGSAAIEFALTLPILVVVLTAVLEYGWYIFQLTSVVHAVRDGTRIGVTVPLDDDSGPESRAITHARNVLEGLGVPCGSEVDCSVDAAISSTGSFDVLTLTIQVVYEPIVGLLPAPEFLRGQFTMRMQDE